jgi:hypothetical protein
MLAIYFHTNIKLPIATHVKYEADSDGERFREYVWGLSLP